SRSPRRESCHQPPWSVQLADRAPEFGADHYRLYHRFRAQVREAAGTEVFDQLRDIRRDQLTQED
ncbi:hypothetical protein, partial [Kitasatospora herbaricolor]